MKLNNSGFDYIYPESVNNNDELLEVSYLYDNENILAIFDAKNTPIENPKFQKIVNHQIKKAEKELSKAKKELARNRTSKAIKRFERAWKYAQLAIRFAKSNN